MANAEDLNAVQEAPWMATLRGGATKLGQLGEAAWNNSPFTLPTRMALAYANSPGAQDTVNRAVDYVKGTNPTDIAETVLRLNPVTAAPFYIKDAMQGKLVDNLRYDAGSAAMIAPDIARSVTALPGFVSDVSGMTGGPTLPQSVTDTLAGAGKWVNDTATPYADDIAGRQVNDTLLRGTPADMASGWRRAVTGGALPIPGAATAPVTNTIMQGVSKLTRGNQLARQATEAAGRTLEVLSPLSINPTPGVVGANAAVSGVMAPGGEAYGESQRIKAEQEKADAVAKQGEALAIQGGQEAGVVKTPVPFGNSSLSNITGISSDTAGALGSEIKKQNATLAGMPTTGDTGDDLKIAGAVVGGFLLARYRRNIGVAVSDATQKFAPSVAKAVGGYDPRLPADKTFQHLNVQSAQQRLNATAGTTESLRRAYKEVAPGRAGHTAADEFADRFKEETAQRTGAAFSHRKAVVDSTGEWLDTNIKSRVPWNDQKTVIDSWSPQLREDYNKLLHINQELDIRNRIYRMYPTNSQPNLHVNNIGYNLYDTPSRDLRTMKRQIEAANPDAPRMAQAWYDMVHDGSRYAGLRGRFEPHEGVRFRQNNPRYVPPTQVKQGQSLLDDRDIVKNWSSNPVIAGTRTQVIPKGVRTFEELGDVRMAQERYLDELMRSTEGMASKRAFYDSMKAIAQLPGGKHARDILGRSGQLGIDAQHKQVSWRDAYGKKQLIEINDAVVRDAFKGIGNPSSMQMINGALQQITRGAQSGMVGPVSIANPTFFPIDSVAYQAISGGAFSRPRGVALGPLDKLVQKAGFEPGLPGDPTSRIAGLGQGVLNIGSVILDRTSKALHNSVLTDPWLVRMVPASTRQAMADMMADWYRKTGLYTMQEAGLMGPGMAGSNRAMGPNLSGSATVTGGIAGRVNSAVRSVTGHDVPNVGAVAKTGYNLVDDVMHAISTGPSVLALKLNKPLLADPTQKWKVTSAIRNMSGDPGQAGAFRGKLGVAEQHLVGLTPFGNPTYQALGRLAESAKRDPTRLAVGIFLGVGLQQMLATMWNSSLGAEYSQWEFFGRPASKIASHTYMGKPGAAPEEGWEMPMEPTFRIFKHAAQAIAGAYTGIFGGAIHAPENADMKAAMDEMLWLRELPGFEQGSVMREVAEQSLLPSPMPLLNAGFAAITGKPMDSYLDLLNPTVQKDNKNAGFIEGTSNDPTKQKLFGMNLPAHTEAVLNAVGGGGAAAILRMITGIESDMAGDAQAGIPKKSLMDSVGYQAEGWKQRAGDTTIGQLFGTRRPVTPSQEASKFVVQRKMSTLDDITDAFNASNERGSERWFGSKKTGKELPAGVAPKQPQDQETAAFAYDVKNIVQRMAPYKEQIKLAYQQYGSIKADTRIPMSEKRIRMENESYRVIDANRRMLQDLQRFEAVLSVKYKRPISFDSYDLDKPFSQQTWKPRWAEQMKQ
jgi:hypothetical protein